MKAVFHCLYKSTLAVTMVGRNSN